LSLRTPAIGYGARSFESSLILDRRRFTLAILAAGLAAGASACGRRGPLEPPPYTQQGRDWARRTGRDRQQQGQPGQPGQPRAANQQTQGSVREGLQRDDDDRNTVDVERDVERRNLEGQPNLPSDPTRSEPGTPATQPGAVTPVGGRRRPPGIVPPKRSFVLDPLLE
jgi:predicted small lipoprotein YifL